MCRGLAASLLGQSESNLEIVPISWAQRWPALQSGDIDVIIKLSGWSQSRDTELNPAFPRPWFVAAFLVMTKVGLGAETVAELDGTLFCVSAGTSTERFLAAYFENLGLDAELIDFESGDEVRSAYFSDRCDALTLPGASWPLRVQFRKIPKRMSFFLMYWRCGQKAFPCRKVIPNGSMSRTGWSAHFELPS
jgi:general L-amino acid transport system substrate-binding protein